MSAEPQELTFGCPNCGNEFIWEPRYAGRRLACPCGQVVVGPTRQQILAAQEEPEDAPPPLEPPRRAESLASIYGAPRRRVVEDDDHERPGWARNVLIPCILLGLGLLILSTQVSWRKPPIPLHIQLGPGRMFGILLAMILATSGALFLAAKFMNLDLGEIKYAILKLCAIPVFAAAMAIPILKFDPDPEWMTGPAMAWSVMILVHWIFIGLLFKLELTETLLASFIVAIAYVIVMAAVLG